jgi:hypothetical protein
LAYLSKEPEVMTPEEPPAPVDISVMVVWVVVMVSLQVDQEALVHVIPPPGIHLLRKSKN